jgi:hypothetical protein
MPLFHDFIVQLPRVRSGEERQGDTESGRGDSADFVGTEDPRTRIASQQRIWCLGQSPADAMGTAAACFRQVAKPSRAKPKMVWRF